MGVAQSTLDSLFKDNPRRYFCAEVPERQVARAAAPAMAQG
jgi:hypothetical protein